MKALVAFLLATQMLTGLTFAETETTVEAPSDANVPVEKPTLPGLKPDGTKDETWLAFFSKKIKEKIEAPSVREASEPLTMASETDLQGIGQAFLGIVLGGPIGVVSGTISTQSSSGNPSPADLIGLYLAGGISGAYIAFTSKEEDIRMRVNIGREKDKEAPLQPHETVKRLETQDRIHLVKRGIGDGILIGILGGAIAELLGGSSAPGGSSSSIGMSSMSSGAGEDNAATDAGRSLAEASILQSMVAGGAGGGLVAFVTPEIAEYGGWVGKKLDAMSELVKKHAKEKGNQLKHKAKQMKASYDKRHEKIAEIQQKIRAGVEDAIGVKIDNEAVAKHVDELAKMAKGTFENAKEFAKDKVDDAKFRFGAFKEGMKAAAAQEKLRIEEERKEKAIMEAEAKRRKEEEARIEASKPPVDRSGGAQGAQIMGENLAEWVGKKMGRKQ